MLVDSRHTSCEELCTQRPFGVVGGGGFPPVASPLDAIVPKALGGDAVVSGPPILRYAPSDLQVVGVYDCQDRDVPVLILWQ